MIRQLWKKRETKGREARNEEPEFRSSNVKYFSIRRVFRTAHGHASVENAKKEFKIRCEQMTRKRKRLKAHLNVALENVDVFNNDFGVVHRRCPRTPEFLRLKRVKNSEIRNICTKIPRA